MKKIYIAGPMTGYYEFNFDSFFRAESFVKNTSLYWFKDKNVEFYNPASEDIKSGLCVTGTTGDPKDIPEFDLREAMKRNCNAICECDGMYMLTGWEKSTGAVAEHALAVCLGMDIKYE